VTAAGTTDAGLVTIGRASAEEAAAILALQKLAYESEARLYDDWTLPPLTQTLDALLDEMARSCLLTALEGGRIAGSVRAREVAGVCHVARLIVHPDLQGRGIGTRLMQAIEKEFPATTRFQLFTGSRSERNIHLYQRLGYVRTHDQVLSPAVTLTFMEKSR
jgi:ribosomal protein S18 acetylase RimI-like enzyme